jgi:hypothetical protein
MVCQWFDLKTTGTVFSDLASKPVATVFSGLPSKPMATVSPVLASKLVVGFLVEPQDQGDRGYSGLEICASKSPRLFLGLDLKTKRATVCQLRHKTDGMVTAWDICQDLAACFT